MQMVLNPTQTFSNTVTPRRVNRAFKSLLDLDAKYEEKINTALAHAKKRAVQKDEEDALRSLQPQARASLETFQRTQARLNASITYA